MFECVGDWVIYEAKNGEGVVWCAVSLDSILKKLYDFINFIH